ncbi:hypothetical protein Efla_002246 [Eimeria flavescens]
MLRWMASLLHNEEGDVTGMYTRAAACFHVKQMTDDSAHWSAASPPFCQSSGQTGSQNMAWQAFKRTAGWSKQLRLPGELANFGSVTWANV